MVRKKVFCLNLSFATGNVCIQITTTLTWLCASIGYDRLKIILDEIKAGEGPGWKIGPIESTMVMYAASMDSPMRYEYAQIYLWAATNANAFHYQKPLEYFGRN